MTITVIDSSAVLRLCFNERDLSQVNAAMGNSPAVSVLATIEVPCAIAARFHRRQISADERDQLLRVAAELLSVATQIDLTEDVRREAIQISERFLVRALDAIHIATAVVLAGNASGNRVRFCTADIRQSEAATALFSQDQVDLVQPYRHG